MFWLGVLVGVIALAVIEAALVVIGILLSNDFVARVWHDGVRR